MSPRISANPPRRARRVVAVALCALLAPLLAPLLTSGPAVAAGPVGYVRLAHLSPDTPDVDVYLSAVSGGTAQRFPGVGYGTVSTYLSVPVGTYAVAMRGGRRPRDRPAGTDHERHRGSRQGVHGRGRRQARRPRPEGDRRRPHPAARRPGQGTRDPGVAARTLAHRGDLRWLGHRGQHRLRDHHRLPRRHARPLDAQGAGHRRLAVQHADRDAGAGQRVLADRARRQERQRVDRSTALRRAAHRHGTHGWRGHRRRRYRPALAHPADRRGRGAPGGRGDVAADPAARRPGSDGSGHDSHAGPPPGVSGGGPPAADGAARDARARGHRGAQRLRPRRWRGLDRGAGRQRRPGRERPGRGHAPCPPPTRPAPPAVRRRPASASRTSAWTPRWSSCTCSPTAR